MKKLWLLVTLLLCLALPCFAEEEPIVYTSGDYEYILSEDGTAKIISYVGNAADLSIPSELDGYAVTSIGDEAFSWCVDLISVTIPDSVTSLGINPFVDCIQLTTINVSPDHPVFATIDNVLFNKIEKKLICYSRGFTAEQYIIPQGITSIGDMAFWCCESLTSITIPNSVTFIGNKVFTCCLGLTSIAIPDSVVFIGDEAFWDCESLTSITIPDSVTFIGDEAFSYCNSLTTISVPRDSYAAQYCKDNGLPYTYPDTNDWLNN